MDQLGVSVVTGSGSRKSPRGLIRHSPRPAQSHQMPREGLELYEDQAPLYAHASGAVSAHSGVMSGGNAVHATKVAVPRNAAAVTELQEHLDRVCSCAPHVNTVAYQGWVDAGDGTYVLVSAWAEHVPLTELLPTLTLWERLSLATQLLTGLNWLHTSAQPVAHGRLRAEHLLLSDSNRVLSIARYGLPVTVWGDRATPDEEDDVYAFGVLLWQLVQGQVDQPARMPPPFSDTFPGELRDMVLDCLAPAPMRPTFEKLMDASMWHGALPQAPAPARGSGGVKLVSAPLTSSGLTTLSGAERGSGSSLNKDAVRFGLFWKAAVDSVLGFDSKAHAVWMHAGLFGNDRVTMEVFKPALMHQLGIATLDQSSPGWQSFAKLVGSEVVGFVGMRDFAQVVQWFGPLDAAAEFFERIVAVTQHDWFHGALDREAAERLLAAHAKDGGWLVRFGSVPGTYTLGVIQKSKEGWNVLHYRIRRHQRGYTTDDKSFYASLQDLFAAKKRDFHMAKVVACSRFVLEKMNSAQKLLIGAHDADEVPIKKSSESVGGSYVEHGTGAE